MSFLGKGKKADLIKLAIELGECESNGEELKIIELRTKILTNDAYKEDPEFVKCIFEGIVSNRIDEENKQKEQTLREFELKKKYDCKMRLFESQFEDYRSNEKRCSPESKEHYLDIWEELISPEMLADKLEAFDNIRRSLPSGPRRYVKASETVNDGRQVSLRKPERPPKREYSHQVTNERSPLRCYGCGKHGVIKSRSPICNLNASQRTDVVTNHINAYTAQTRSPR
ncbi:uncharacterized protein TNCV_4054581 [Trichonephila clavipes]|nr:uncharacterized protein TNCV_4054581 [Trichonephila clavipes]